MYKTLVNPISEMQQMFDLMDRVFVNNQHVSRRSEDSALTLPVDIWEKDNAFFVRAAVPGIKPEELDITVEDGILTLRGETRNDSATEDSRVWRSEYSYGSFVRSLRLPENVSLDTIDASFDNGFVTIVVPKVAEQKKSLKVPVRTGQPHGEPKAIQDRTNGTQAAETRSKEPVSAAK